MDRFPNGEKIDPTRSEWGIIKLISGTWHYILRDKNGNVQVYPILIGGTIGAMVIAFTVVQA